MRIAERVRYRVDQWVKPNPEGIIIEPWDKPCWHPSAQLFSELAHAKSFTSMLDGTWRIVSISEQVDVVETKYA